MPDIFVDPSNPTDEVKPEEVNDSSIKLDDILPEKVDVVIPQKTPQDQSQEVAQTPPPNGDSTKDEVVSKATQGNPEPPKHKHTPHIFATYCPNPPKEVVYANREENEVLLLFLRRHLITNLPWILKALLMGSVPVIFAILNNYGVLSITFLTAEQKAIITFFYYFTIFSAYVFVNYLTWFYNISLVSNERVIDIDFSNLVFEDVSATKLSQVEDVHYSQIGLSRSIFDYGDVLVQTAASQNEFQFKSVPHPERVIKIINNLIGGAQNA